MKFSAVRKELVVAVILVSGIMACFVLSKVKERQAFENVRVGAEGGSPRDQYQLGFFYSTGQGVSQDSSKALMWYQRAAEQGDAMGENGLGYLYANGRGVSQDYEEALHWYRKAAAQRNAKAEYNIGNMLYYGKGIPLDRTEANRWFVKAADDGDENAQRIIGTRWIGQENISRAVLPILSLFSVMYLANAIRRHRSLFGEQYMAITLTTTMGIAYLVVGVYLLPRMDIAHSLFTDHVSYFAMNVILGMYVMLFAELMLPSKWKVAAANAGVGICCMVLIGFDVYVGKNSELLSTASFLRLSFLINGILIGMIISIVVVLPNGLLQSRLKRAANPKRS